MTVFIPCSDYSESATTAETITTLDVGYVKAGQTVAVSFKVGNRSDIATDETVSSDNPQVSLSVDSVTLEPDEISDTVTATITAPLDCQTTLETSYVTAGDISALTLTWETVGANVDRLPQVPDRMGDFTDNITSVLDRVGEVLRVYTFDPIPYDETDERIFVMPEGADRRFKSQRDVCSRLDPLDDRWGYRRSVQTVVGSFQSEDWSITSSFTRDNSSITYSGSAVLYLPAEFELIRSWALFNDARGADRAQYKRTVFVTQRQGQVWALQTIVPIYRGEQLAYWHVHLVPLSQPTMGSPGSFNPFATTYEYQSDRPYAQFSCQTDIRFAEQLLNPSEEPATTEPVALSLGDASAYVLRTSRGNVQVVSLCATNISSWEHRAHTLTDETWNVNEANIKSVWVETDYEGEWILALLPTPSVTTYDDLFTVLGTCQASSILRSGGTQSVYVDFPYKDETGQRSVHLWFSGILRNEAGEVTGFPEATASRIYVHAIA